MEEDNNNSKESKIKKFFSKIKELLTKIGKNIKRFGLFIASKIRLPKKEENKLLPEGKKVKKNETKNESKEECIPLEDLLSNLKEQNLFDELKLNEIKQYADTHGEEEAKNKYAYNLNFAKMDITRKKILEEKQDREFRRELRVNPDKSQISEEKDTKKEPEKENDENGER